MQNKKIGAVALLALAVAAPSAAEAAVRLKVAKALSGDSEFTQDTDFLSNYSREGDYTPLAVNVAFINEQGGFFDIGYSTAEDDTTSSFGNPWSSERSDLTLTAGASRKGFGGYVGFRSGEAAYHQTNISASGEHIVSSMGFVFGLSGQFKPAPKHTIAVTGGLGILFGDWEDTYNNEAVDFDWTSGFSWGLAYSFQAAEKVAVGLEHKSQSYDFEWVDDGTLGTNLDITESLSSTSLFVSYVF